MPPSSGPWTAVPTETEALYHGTRRGVSRGGWLTPPSFHGEERANVLPGYPDADQYIFMTPDVEVAETFAYQAKGRGRPKVLTVVPTEPIERDLATWCGMDGYLYRSRGWAKVVAVRILDEDCAPPRWVIEDDEL